MSSLMKKWFGISDDASTEAQINRPSTQSEGLHTGRRQENRRPRQHAKKTDVERAQKGDTGQLTLYPVQGEVLIVNIWKSPNQEHVDRFGNRGRKLFPVSLYRRGKRIVGFPRVKGPSLPIGLLYGKSVDPARLPEEHREGLELVVKAIPRGIEAYFADVIHEEST